ncbi:MAG: YraN family protein [Nitrospirae bacterium]|nr:YraN family protein [Nitrospirota bacterium]
MNAVRHFRRQKSTHARGRSAEADGVLWLEQQGFRVVARNVRTKAGELDVVGLDGDTLAFVEIKARSTSHFGPASCAVPPTKQRRIARAAALYLTRHPNTGPCRFDVLAMDMSEDGWVYRWIRDAFDAC